jgi:O-antigen/teichoic acid export membrane protein
MHAVFGPKSRRAATVTSSYLVTALITLGVIVALRKMLAPREMIGVLSFIFVYGIAAGIDPGTVKQLLIKQGGAPESTRLPLFGVLIATGAKAAALSPLLALTWYLAQPGGFGLGGICLWAPLIAILGFVTTDVRSVFDVNGRYAMAIWLKQGSIATGLISLALALAAGMSFPGSIALVLLARLLWLALFLYAGRDYFQRGRVSHSHIAGELSERCWFDILLVSVFGAISGSLDRVIAFRYLSAGECSDYYMVYEVISKFWLVSYLLSPVVFARRIKLRNQSVFLATAIRCIGISGGVLIGASILAVTALSGQISAWVGIGLNPHAAGVVLFSVAIVLTGFSQVFAADIQGFGETSALLKVSLLVTALSACCFYLTASSWGLNGLYGGWLARGVLELAMLAGVWKATQKRGSLWEGMSITASAAAVPADCSNAPPGTITS